MADISVTANNVAPITGSTQIEYGIAGATITAGQSVYLDASTQTFKLADANASAATAALKGIALNGAASGQPLAVATGGTLNPGFAGTVGQVVVLSATAGGLAPVGDLTTGWYTTIVGVVTAASVLTLKIFNSGATN